MRTEYFRAHQRVCLPVIATAILGCSAGAASAEERGWYAGLSQNDTNIEVERGGGFQQGPHTSGNTFSGGLRLTHHFAMDFGLSQSDDVKWTEYWAEVPDVPSAYKSSLVFDATALRVGAVGIAPFANIWEAYAKGGFAYYRLNGKQSLSTWSGADLSRPMSASDVGFLFGIGVGVTVASDWHLGFGMESLWIDEAFLGINGCDASMNSYTLGVEYRFGRRKQSL